MNYSDIIIKKYGCDINDFDVGMDVIGRYKITRWEVKGHTKPTISSLTTYYNANQTVIDAEAEKKQIIEAEKKRVIREMVESKLIEEGKI